MSKRFLTGATFAGDITLDDDLNFSTNGFADISNTGTGAMRFKPSSQTLALTLTGANATFAGDVTANGDGSFGTSGATNNSSVKTLDGSIITKIQSQTAGDTAGILGTESNNVLKLVTNNSTAITIDTSQNSTFAGNVTISTTGQGLKISTAAGQSHLQFTDSTNSKNAFVNYDNDVLKYFSNGPVEQLSISSTGATFAGNVTADKLVIDGASNSNVSQLALTRTDFSWGIFNETNLRFYVQSGNTTTPNTQVLEIGTSGNLDLSAGGILKGMSVLELKNNGSTDGSATSPRLYSPASGTLAFSGNGAERMRITSGGDIAVGVTSAQGRIHIHNSGTSYLHISNDTTGSGSGSGTDIGVFTGTSDLQINNREAASVAISTSNTEKMRITSGGDVGIGINAPNAKANIENGHLLVSQSANTTQENILLQGAGYHIGSTLYGNVSIRSSYNNSSNSGSLNFYTAASGTTTAEKMRLDGDGNLGINSTSPSTYNAQLVSFKDGGSFAYLGHNNSGGTFPKVSALSFGSSAVSFSHTTNGGTNALTGSAQIAAIQSASSNAVTDMAFYTTAGGSVTEKMRLDSSGNLGIGISPVTLKSATTLQVNGNAKLGDANDRGLLSLGDIASTGANAGIWRGAAGAYGSAGNFLNIGGYDGITFTTGNADISSQTTALTIDASQNSTFAGNVTVSNSSPSINLTDTDNSSNIAFSSVGGALIVNSASDQVYQIGGAEKFRITSSGVSVTGSGTFTDDVTIDNSSPELYLTPDSAKYSWMIAAQENVDQHFEITPSTTVGGSTFNAPALKINGANNAATFAGDITATSKKFISTSSSSGDYVRLYAGGGTAQWDIYGSGENLRLSENSSGGGIFQVDSGASFGGEVSLKSRLNLQRSSGGATTLIQFKNENGVDRAHIDFGGTNEELSFFSGSGGSEHMRIDGSGNVIVNDTSSDLSSSGRGVIEINGTSQAILGLKVNGDVKTYLFQNGNNVELNNTASGSLTLKTAATTALTLDSSQNATFAGRVGIGGDNPGDRQLYVEGTASIIEIASTTHNQNASVWFRSNRDGTNADRWEIGTNISQGSNFELLNRATSTAAFHVDSSNNNATFTGNVLIGATSAAAGVLVVDGNSANNIWVVGRDSDGTGSLSFRNAADNAYNARLEAVSGALKFETNGTLALTIDSSQNVGIGTDSPDEKLDITGGYLKFNGGDYGLKGSASLSYNATSDHYFQSGGSTKVTFKAGGNVGIGTTSPGYKLEVNGTAYINGETTVDDTLKVAGTIQITGTGALPQSGAGIYRPASDTLGFFTSGNSRMRISSSGDILFGTSTKGNDFAYFEAADNNRRILHVGSSSTGSETVVIFRNPNGAVGSVITDGSTTSFGSSSDYRLKENVVEMTDALDRVSQLKPSRFNFIANPDKTYDGFLAHEVQDIVPEAISGDKDEVDEDGNEKYQGIDQSKLVPLLVGAIQELKAEIENLKSQINN